ARRAPPKTLLNRVNLFRRMADTDSGTSLFAKNVSGKRGPPRGSSGSGPVPVALKTWRFCWGTQSAGDLGKPRAVGAREDGGGTGNSPLSPCLQFKSQGAVMMNPNGRRRTRARLGSTSRFGLGRQWPDKKALAGCGVLLAGLLAGSPAMAQAPPLLRPDTTAVAQLPPKGAPPAGERPMPPAEAVAVPRPAEQPVGAGRPGRL